MASMLTNATSSETNQSRPTRTTTRNTAYPQRNHSHQDGAGSREPSAHRSAFLSKRGLRPPLAAAIVANMGQANVTLEQRTRRS